MICPICNKKRHPGEFERHHIVWRRDGGSNDPINLLEICRTCHAIVTRGCTEDRIPIDMACFAFALSRRGLTFLLKSNVIFSDHPVWGKAFVDEWAGTSAEEVDSMLLQAGDAIFEKYIRDVRGEQPTIPINTTEENKPPEASQ